MKHHKCPHCKQIYENKDDLYYPKKTEKRNLWKWLFILMIIGFIVLAIGILGYQIFEGNDFVASLYKATTIVSGIGATDIPSYDATRIFLSFYSIIVGLLYVIIITIFVGIAATESRFFLTQ